MTDELNAALQDLLDALKEMNMIQKDALEKLGEVTDKLTKSITDHE